MVFVGDIVGGRPLFVASWVTWVIVNDIGEREKRKTSGRLFVFRGVDVRGGH